jgi:hypothetical protein
MRNLELTSSKNCKLLDHVRLLNNPVISDSHPKAITGGIMRKNRESEEYQSGNKAGLDELGNDPREVGPDSAGQSGDPQRLSTTEDADNESVEELDDTDQALEAARVEGSEDAANHPERPVHTHIEYGRPDDLPPARSSDRKKAS